MRHTISRREPVELQSCWWVAVLTRARQAAARRSGFSSLTVATSSDVVIAAVATIAPLRSTSTGLICRVSVEVSVSR